MYVTRSKEICFFFFHLYLPRKELEKQKLQLISEKKNPRFIYMYSSACDVEASPIIILITILKGKAEKRYSYSLETEKKRSHIEWQLELQCLELCKEGTRPPI